MRLVLLGDPVAHSRSPAIHEAALAHLGIPGSYVARRVDAAGLAKAVAEVRRGDLDGANVTMPHKRRAAGHCDRLAGAAARAGAVNTLLQVADGVAGHLTDVTGVTVAWDVGHLPRDAPVLVLGAGGAAAAALIALEHRELFIAARSADRAAAVLEALGVAAAVVSWGAWPRDVVVVNATSLGMGGESLPAGVLDGAVGLLEMVYGGTATPAVAAMRDRGLPVADGLDMLVGQAAAAFELWTGRPAPMAVMRTAAGA